MPHCTAQQAAYDLAVITEAVRLAQWAVEQAEAMLAHTLYQAAVADRIVKPTALTQCQTGGGAGGGAGGRMAAKQEPTPPSIAALQETVEILRKICGDLMQQETELKSAIEDASQRVE